MALALPASWHFLGTDWERAALQRRYELEISGQHQLSGLAGEVFARSDANDDILVRVKDGRYAIVRLSWGRDGDDTAPPAAQLYASDAQLAAALDAEWMDW